MGAVVYQHPGMKRTAGSDKGLTEQMHIACGSAVLKQVVQRDAPLDGAVG